MVGQISFISPEELLTRYVEELFYGASLWIVKGERAHAIKEHQAGVSLYYVNDTLYNGHEQDSAPTLAELVEKCHLDLTQWQLSKVYKITGQPKLFE